MNSCQPSIQYPVAYHLSLNQTGDALFSHFCADERSRPSLPALDVCVTSDDKRYFVSETDDITNLEASVLESPEDTQLWIKLAFKYLGQNET